MAGRHAPQVLRDLLSTLGQGAGKPRILLLPCAFDGLTARMIDRAGFHAAFMTGFGVSASHGVPDTGLLGLQEMSAAARIVCGSTSLPVIVDGDTGYGNALNVKRTIRAFAGAGAAGVMIEDQVSPKRCGHTRGKDVVDFSEALARIQAACDARDELGPTGPLVLARTDARHTHGLDAALDRCRAFRAAGADMTFLEAPRSEEEMAAYCGSVDGPKLANMIDHGLTPVLPPERLAELGFSMAAYPLALLSAAVKVYGRELARIRDGRPAVPEDGASFDEVQAAVGFPEYWAEEERYGIARKDPQAK